MTSMPINLSFAKRYLSEQLLKKLLGYLDADPEANIPRLLTLLQRTVPYPRHRRQASFLLHLYQENPQIHALIHRIFALHPAIKRGLLYNWFVNAQMLGVPQRDRLGQELGVNIPNFILLDPTSACNLHCTGCWAGDYPHHDTLDLELVDRICREAKALGIYWIAMSGGEPFLWPHLAALAKRHQDMAFMLYTNGTLIDDAMADQLLETGNISPAISLEGWRETTDARRGHGVFDRIMASTARLRERKLIFGISLTITRQNVEEVTSDAFIRFVIEQGALYGWSFHYIPIGRNPDPELMVTSEQRAYLAGRIGEIRAGLGFPIADFWNDGELTGGCLAGGRRYFHITADGTVEPCAFVHFTTHNIREMSLLEVLRSPLFRAFQRRQPFSENLLRSCPIIDTPELLRDIVAETGARPSHPGADTVIRQPIAAALDEQAACWKETSDAIWQQRHPDSEPETARSAVGHI